MTFFMTKLKEFIDKYFSYIVYVIFFLVVIVQYSRSSGVLLEDGYIMLHYVQNILAGDGWVFNIGEYYNSATSVLQVLLHVFLGGVFGVNNLVVIAHMVFFIWMFFCGVSIYLFLKSIDRYVAMFAALAILVSSHMYQIGMEHAMNMTFLFLALYSYKNNKYRALYILLLLFVFTRFENILIVPLFFASLYFTKKQNIKELFVGSLYIFIPLGIWLAWSYFYFGEFLPQTLQVKVWQGESGRWGEGFIYLKSLFEYLKNGFGAVPSTIGSLISIVLGLLSFFAIYKKFNVKNLEFLILFVFLVMHTFLYGIIFNVPGYFWYYTLFVVTIICFGFVGAFSIAHKDRKISYIFIVILFIPFLYNYIVIFSSPINDPRINNYHEVADWLKYNTSPDSILLHDEVGAIAFYSKHRTLDTLGLTNPQYLPALKKGQVGLFWVFVLPKYSEAYYLSLSKDLVDDNTNVAYKTKDGSIFLLKMDKEHFLYPKSDQISLFNFDYKLDGPSKSYGQQIVNLQPSGLICPSFVMKAGLDAFSSAHLNVVGFDKTSHYSLLSFYSVFPLVALQNHTDGNFVLVKIIYEDGEISEYNIEHRVDINTLTQNFMRFDLKIDNLKLLRSIEVHPYDKNTTMDLWYMCNPVLSK